MFANVCMNILYAYCTYARIYARVLAFAFFCANVCVSMRMFTNVCMNGGIFINARLRK